MTSAIFVLSMQATAGPANSDPDGRRYDLLVFARGDDEDAAREAALHGLQQLGWIDAATLRAGEITNPDGIPDDLRGAYARACASGCAVIVYDQP